MLGDKAFDADWLRKQLHDRGASAVIPPRRHRKHRIDYDAHMYRWRHPIENHFARIKEFRDIATRYGKTVCHLSGESQSRRSHHRCQKMSTDPGPPHPPFMPDREHCGQERPISTNPIAGGRRLNHALARPISQATVPGRRGRRPRGARVGPRGSARRRTRLAHAHETEVAVTRMSLFSNPLLLGFDQFERTLERVAKASADGYPPCDIEQLGQTGLRITLAVAGFTLEELDVVTEDSQLIVRGRHVDDKERVFVHRGIAARQFQRSFVLADGIEVTGAALDNGLLKIDLARPVPQKTVRSIAIMSSDTGAAGGTVDVEPDG